MYKLQRGALSADGSAAKVVAVNRNDIWSIPFDLANIDYANFKRDINDSKDKLQDADGNEMSVADAKAYVATLP